MKLLQRLAECRCIFYRGGYGRLAVTLAVVLLAGGERAHAGLTINATFGSGFTSADKAAIETAITNLENAISTNVTVNIQINTMSSGLGESSTYYGTLSYYDYYNALKAVDTAPGASAAQQTAFASLGAAPTSESSGNPVNGSTTVDVMTANLRALGFSASVPFDSTIGLNTSITSPYGETANTYSLQSVAAHEIDEALGIGGSGSTIGEGTNDIGVLDLYRYRADGARSWTTILTTSPYSYFSIDGGKHGPLVLQSNGRRPDYADWHSNPIPRGFRPQVQDAFGQPVAHKYRGSHLGDE